MTEAEADQLRFAFNSSLVFMVVAFVVIVLVLPGKNGERRWTNIMTALAALWARYAPPTVNPSASPASGSYGKSPEWRGADRSSVRHPALDADADADADDAPDAPPIPFGSILLSEKDLQARLDQAEERGKALAFGRLLGAGYLATMVREQRTTAAKDLVFDGSGRVKNRVKPIIDSEAERCRPPVALETTPIVGREVAAGTRFQEIAE